MSSPLKETLPVSRQKIDELFALVARAQAILRGDDGKETHTAKTGTKKIDLKA